MRILYHHRTRAEDAQGVHIRELIHAFRQLGHQVTLVAPLARRENAAASPDAGAEKGNSLLNFSIPHWLYELIIIGYNLPAIALLSWRLLRGRHDFIYERYSLFSIGGCVVSRLFRLPLILEVNAPLSLEMQQHGELMFTRLAQRAEDWILARATRVVVVTAAMRQIFVDRGLDPGRFLVMPNGVDREAFDRDVDPAPVRRRWRLDGCFVVGFVGWIRPWHGVDYLIRAAAACLPQQPALRLLIVGDGPAVPELKALARTLGVEQQVLFTGAVDARDIPRHIAAMDVAVQPDVTPYASPIKLFEYLAMGRAVIAPDKPNILEVVSNDVTALIYRPGDVDQLRRLIERLGQDPALRARLAAAAYALIGQRGYYWAANAARVIDVIEDVTGDVAAPAE